MNAPQPLGGRTGPVGTTRMTRSEAFVESLVAQGVDTMFGIMGAAFMDAMDIFAPAGIRLIPVVALSLIHLPEPTRPYSIPYAVFCLQKKTNKL